MEIELRKNLDIIYIVGTGTMFFSVWGLFKGIAINILSYNGVETLEGISPGNLSPRIVISLLGINLAVEFLLRVIIGCCSRLEGRGEKAGSFYIFLTGVLVVWLKTKKSVSATNGTRRRICAGSRKSRGRRRRAGVPSAVHPEDSAAADFRETRKDQPRSVGRRHKKRSR